MTTDADRQPALHALAALHILDTPPEDRFNRIARLAQRVLDVPIAAVGFADTDREWCKAWVGFEPREVPAATSFARHAIAGDGRLIVSDASTDPRFHVSPLVAGQPGARMVMAHAVRSPGGERIGAVWAASPRAGRPTEEDMEVLAHLAGTAEHELGAIEPAVIDRVTGLANRRGFTALARKMLTVADDAGLPATLLFCDLNDFRALAARGVPDGDRILRDAAGVLRATFRESDLVARLSNDEFVVLLVGSTTQTAEAAVARLTSEVARRVEDQPGLADVTFSVGAARHRAGEVAHINPLIDRAAERMEIQRERWRAQSA